MIAVIVFQLRVVARAPKSVSIAPRLVLLTKARCGRPGAGFAAIARAAAFSSFAALPRFGLAKVYVDAFAIAGTPVDADTSAPRYVVVDAGGLFSWRRSLLPVALVRFDEDARVLRVPLDKDIAARYPAYSSTQCRPDKFANATRRWPRPSSLRTASPTPPA